MEFPSTHWSLLAEATLNGDTAASAALGGFCTRYRRALMHFARHCGVVDSELEDVVQEFLAEVSHGSMLRRADRSSGSFRSFLIGAFRRYLSHYWRRRFALKRGEAVEKVPMDETRLEAEADPDEAAVFDRFWAVALMESATESLREEFEKADRGAAFEVVLEVLPGNRQRTR